MSTSKSEAGVISIQRCTYGFANIWRPPEHCTSKREQCHMVHLGSYGLARKASPSIDYLGSSVSRGYTMQVEQPCIGYDA